MLRFTMLATALLVLGTTQAQQPFEGSITYAIKESGNQQAVIMVHIGARGVRASYMAGEKMDENEILVLFDSSATYQLNSRNRTYSVERSPKIPEVLQKDVMIAGYKARLQKTSGRPFSSQSFTPGSVVYASDEMIVNVPPQLAGVSGLMMLHDAKVVLGMIWPSGDAQYSQPFDSAWADPEFQGVIIKAINVVQQKLPDSLFSIAADYTLNISSSDMLLDTSMIIDSAAEADPLPPPPPPKKAPARKAPAKTKVKSAARKPE